MRGRRAALPAAETRTEHGMLERTDRLVVRRFSQDGQERRDFAFTHLPCSPEMRQALAAAFARRTAPGTRVTSLSSMESIMAITRAFARYLAGLRWPPREPPHLTTEHFDGFYASRTTKHAAEELANLRRLLFTMDGISDALAARMAGDLPKPAEPDKRDSYSRTELKRIADAARADLRAAAKRIRENRELLARWRDGELNLQGADIHLTRRIQILDHIDRCGDVPRKPSPNPRRAGRIVPEDWIKRHGTIRDVMSWLHLSLGEVAAAAVLLAVMTGQNPEVIAKAPAAHHRADGFTGGPGTAIIDLRKLRRGRRAWMSLALSDFPDWVSIPEDTDIPTRDELHTPFGLYVLLHELTAGTRALIGGNRLLAGYHWTGHKGRGLRAVDPHHFPYAVRKKVQAWHLMQDRPEDADDGYQPVPLLPTMEVLRLTYIELHQVPVAHTVQTSASTYLARNRGNIAEYQKVVAEALTEEVAKARTRHTVAAMTTADVEKALADPETAAAEQGLDPATLARMLEGKLDTVLAACSDNTGGRFNPGEPCRASFMLCLECECARALPRHLPVQVVVHDRLEQRRRQMDALRWARRFAEPHARLADILDQHDATAVADARAQAGPAEHALADRFLNRELDLR